MAMTEVPTTATPETPTPLGTVIGTGVLILTFASLIGLVYYFSTTEPTVGTEKSPRQKRDELLAAEKEQANAFKLAPTEPGKEPRVIVPIDRAFTESREQAIREKRLPFPLIDKPNVPLYDPSKIRDEEPITKKDPKKGVGKGQFGPPPVPAPPPLPPRQTSPTPQGSNPPKAEVIPPKSETKKN